MDPVFLGRTHCFDVDSQCILGQETTHNLQENTRLKNAFSESCSALNGSKIRCCPLNLINRPYNPPQDGSVIPIHIKFNNGRYDVCPESIRSQCSREQGQDLGLCIAQKCSDAGYLEPSNYYQICKAYKKFGLMQRVPDCPVNKCNLMMSLPEWYKQGLARNTSKDTTLEEVEVPPQEMKLGLTFEKLTKMMPSSDNFYIKSSLILGGFVVILLVILYFWRPYRIGFRR